MGQPSAYSVPREFNSDPRSSLPRRHEAERQTINAGSAQSLLDAAAQQRMRAYLQEDRASIVRQTAQ